MEVGAIKVLDLNKICYEQVRRIDYVLMLVDVMMVHALDMTLHENENFLNVQHNFFLQLLNLKEVYFLWL